LLVGGAGIAKGTVDDRPTTGQMVELGQRQILGVLEAGQPAEQMLQRRVDPPVGGVVDEGVDDGMRHGQRVSAPPGKGKE